MKFIILIFVFTFRDTTHAQTAKKMGELFDCPTENSAELVKCLQEINSVALTEAQWKTHEFFHKSPAKLPLSTFLPRIDSEAEYPFMPESGLELLRQGHVDNLPWMVGLTSLEGAWAVSPLYGQDSMEYLKEFDQHPIRALRALTAHMVADENVSIL
jgi:hypothetical protein